MPIGMFPHQETKELKVGGPFFPKATLHGGGIVLVTSRNFKE
jgi:hypothetical protein